MNILFSRLERSVDKKDLKILCKSLQFSASIYFYACDYEQSLELLLKSLEICEKIGYKEYLSRLYNCIGNVYSSFKDYETSNKYYFLAYNNVDTKNFNLHPSILNNIGTLYRCTGQYDSAVYYLEKT